MSTNKTENYQLHKWEPGDDFLRSEFNENFAKLDEELFGYIVAGAYTGDGATERFLNLGFTPRAVVIIPQDGRLTDTYLCAGGIALPGNPAIYNNDPRREIFSVVEGGLRAICNLNRGNSSTDTLTNSLNKVYFYLAVR